MRTHSDRAAPAPLSLLVTVLGLAALPACAPSFENARTPSGQYCSDMPIYLNNQAEPDRAFHRIKPIATPLAPLTAPQRLEALRKEACTLGGDAVINAGDEETQLSDHSVVVRASGYAVRWTAPTIRSISTRSAPGGGTIGAPSGLSGNPAPAAGATPEIDDGAVVDGDGGTATKVPAIAPRKKALK